MTQTGPNPFDQQQSIPNVKRIIAVSAGKGGVGKSTVSTNLALALSKRFKVGLLDADIYGPSIPRMMGALNQKPTITSQNKIEPLVRFGLKLMSMGFLIEENSAVIWRGPMLFKAMDQFFKDVNWGELDYLVIDLPPGTGDIQLTMAQKVLVSGAIAVSTGPTCVTVEPALGIYVYTSNALDGSISALQMNANTGQLSGVANSPFPTAALPSCVVAVANGSHATEIVSP